MRNVGFILVYVENVAASQAFYASILGRPAIESSNTFAMVPAAPGLMLGLWRRDGVKPAPSASAVGGGEIAFPVDNPAEVDATFAEWRGRGVRIALEPTQMDFGYTFVALDPNRKPRPVPELIAETEEEKRLYEGALRRRQLRLILGGKMKPEDAGELKAFFLK